MRIIDKLLPFLSISLSTMVMGQLPFFLQRFRPKQGLLGSGTSYSSLFNPLPSSSLISPTYSSLGSLFGSSNNFGSSLPFGSSSFGSSSFGSLGLGSSSFGSLGLGSAPLPSTSIGSFTPPNFGSSLFAPSSFGTSSLTPPNFGSSSGTSSFTSSGIGSPLFASASFASPSIGYSPFATATFNSPSILSSPLGQQKFEPLNLGSSSLADFSTAGNFEGLGGFDPIDLIDDYPGFSNTGFGKDMNFAGSQTVKYQAPSSLGNEYSYLKRSTNKK